MERAPAAFVNYPSYTACRRSTLFTLHDAEYWQKRAKEARAKAEQMSSAEDKRELLDIAKAYERMAELASGRKILRRVRRAY